jgi:hypothetical protein
VHQLITYLLAFSIGMVAVGALPRLRQRQPARARTKPDRRRDAAEETWLAAHRMAVAMWAVGCLLTGALAALVANLAG